MKQLFYLFGLVIALAVVISACEKTQDSIDDQQPETSLKAKPNGCATIPGGTIFTSGGVLITPGYMENGYNYQAHIYNGDYGYPDWHLVMKWNDAWLSNKDCDDPLGGGPDGLLDRPYDENGVQYYYGSGAWVTNHWTTTYTNANGDECEYDYFIKIIAVPSDATLNGGIWYNVAGVEIGPVIWGQFAIVQEVENDPCEGIEGVQYKSPDHPGLGGW